MFRWTVVFAVALLLAGMAGIAFGEGAVSRVLVCACMVLSAVVLVVPVGRIRKYVKRKRRDEEKR